ncbi:MAG: sugar phosphate isomerase/epimerase [Oscillospiraceae bacterium]|nr:sugar phosphate isomerase/epimerase [Oscillospiraceae bacterium]
MNEKICFYWAPFPRVKSYYDMIDVSAEYGMTAIEGFSMFEFQTPDVEAAKKIRQYADSKNVKFVCFSVYINLVGEDSAEKLRTLKGYADVARILGSPYLHHTIANAFSHPEKIVPRREELFEKGVCAVREIYDYAKSIGVRTIYEEQGYVFNGIDGFGRFLDTVDRNVGVVADFANICQAGEDVLGFIDKYSDRIVHAHIKDVTITEEDRSGDEMKTLTGKYMNEAVIGEGIVRIKEGISRLQKLGYSGYYGIEYSAKSDDSPTVANSISFIDEAL